MMNFGHTHSSCCTLADNHARHRDGLEREAAVERRALRREGARARARARAREREGPARLARRPGDAIPREARRREEIGTREICAGIGLSRGMRVASGAINSVCGAR